MAVTDKQAMLMEYTRCASDPIHTIERYFETFDKTQEGFVPFKLFEIQKNLIKNYEKHRFNLVVKYRQAGISTVTAGYCAVKTVFAPKSNPERILILANKLETAIEFQSKILTFIKQLPPWVNVSFTKSAQKHVKLMNGSEIKAVATSPDALRGYTPTILILDEAAFIEGGQDLWVACLAAIGTGGQAFLISTPNGLDEIYYEAYEGSLNNTNSFYITHLNWWEDPRFGKNLKLIKTKDVLLWIQLPKEEQKEYEVIEDASQFSKEELLQKFSEGYRPYSSWYENMCREMNLNRRLINQELECAFIGSGDNVVDAEAIRTQELTNVKNPLYKDREWDNELWIWQEPQKGHRYILGCLPENEMVLTNKGLVKAQNITFKNKLINKEGELVRIKNIQEYDVENCYKYKLTIENTYRTTTFTHEHPIYCSKDKINFDFIPIKDIKKNDWLKIPNIYNKELDYAWVENENYWWLIGILLSKGVFQKDDKRFGIYNYGINKNDIDKIKNILTEYDVDTIFSDEYTFIFRKDESEWDILYDIDDYNRYISEKIKYLPKQYKVFLLDGIITTLTKLKPNKKTTLIGDLVFLEGIQDILLSLGIVSKGYKNKLIIDKVNTLLLMDLLPSYSNSEFKYIDKIYNPNKIKNKNSIYFNDDFSYIYLRIKTIHCSLHTGKVYNYECETNSYMCYHIPTHNCDVSRGDSEDATGITIIDYDTYEQVAEYHGKIPPDIAAELVNKYGRLYNALSTFDITGGMGIAATNKLKDLHYPRNLLHYDNITDDYFYIPPIDAIPGINFASRNRRSQIVAALEEAIVRGGFKLRSQRLAAELKKFIYRNGRPDHMKNSHDDLIMALGMCLFVGNTAFKRLQESDNLTKAMLDSWRVVEEPFFNKTTENIKEVLNTNPQEGKVYNNNDNGNNTLYNTKQYGWLFSTKKRQ